jgi:hypothetical protein
VEYPIDSSRIKLFSPSGGIIGDYQDFIITEKGDIYFLSFDTLSMCINLELFSRVQFFFFNSTEDLKFLPSYCSKDLNKIKIRFVQINNKLILFLVTPDEQKITEVNKNKNIESWKNYINMLPEKFKLDTNLSIVVINDKMYFPVLNTKSKKIQIGCIKF